MTESHPADRRGASRLSRLVLAAALAAPLVWWLHLALVSPEGRMLAPGRGEWIVPADPVLPDPRDGSPARVRYVVLFETGGAAEARARRETRAAGVVPVEIEAEGDVRVAVAGVVRFASARRSGAGGRPVRLDLGPWLRPGTNQVAIEVADPRGPGPLRVVAGPGAPPALRIGLGEIHKHLSPLPPRAVRARPGRRCSRRRRCSASWRWPRSPSGCRITRRSRLSSCST